GVYKSTDGGLNWILMNTGLTNPRIHTLEVDPNNGDVVYAGSEQPDGPPTGVFRTTDGAASWAQLGGGLPSPLFPNQIAVHPADSNLVWVVSGMQNGGVYRSTDGGANWQKLLDGNVTVVGVDPGDVNRVYVGTGWNNGIYRSLDGGTTWALVNHGLWLSPGIVSLVVNPADPEQLFLGTTAGLYELRLRGAVTMTVDNTNDSGLGSLRDAVMQANADGTPSVIRFDPSLAGASIQLLSGLPALSEDWTTIDGDLDGDCVPDVELNGELAGSNGLDVCSSYNTIRGLNINRFSGHGIFINPFDCPPADFNRVECNYIGTDFAGTGPAGNGGNGVTVKGDALDNQVGPANVIAFNVSSGVSVDDGINWAYPDFSALTPDTVQVFPLIDFTDDCGAFHSADDITPVDGSGNAYYDTFGARFTGTLALGADGDYTFELQDVDELARLLIDGSPILDVSCCGTYTATLWYSAGDHPIELDYMEFRYNASVRLVITGPGSATLTTGGQPGLQGEIFQLRKPSERNRITENSIFDNQHFGIELIGCAPNDPGDVDIGSNTVLNYPEFTGSTDHGGGWFSVEGDAPPDSTVELFAAAPDLDQGRGEGKEFLTAVPADGDGTFAATIELPTGDWAVTATATDGDGNTSEFSAFFGLRPNPITVSSIDDSGPGSLRDAIEEANSDGYPSTITCDPGLAGETIALDSGLPPLTEDGTTIDGDLDGDCVPDVELDGSSAGSTDGIVVFSSDNRIRGLAISRFESSGILIMSNGPAADRNVVECNYLGTDLSGTVALGNGLSGVSVQNVANDNVIGPGNLVSGNLGNGVQVDASDGNVVWGNRIGTDATGATGLPNPVGVRLANGASGNTVGGPGNAGNRILGTTGGVEIADGGTYGNQVLGNRIGWPEGQRPVAERAPSLGQPTPAAACGMDPVGADLPLRLGRSPWLPEPPWCASEGPDVRGPTEPAAVAVGYGVRVHGGPAGNQIGGTSPGEGNEITRNGGAGVVVEGDGTTEIAIRGNHIDANGGLGIDLGADGVSPNDPGDGDGGPNHRMNFPVLSRAVTDGVTTDIEGVIDSPSPENVTVELYANTAADPSGYGEGETLLMSIAPDPSGNFAVTVAAVAAGTRITATATDPALSTSEFSPALEVAGPTAAATALTATAESSSAIRLRWTDPDDGESGFRVERSHDGASWGPVDAVGPDAASYLDQDLGPASPNYYRVLAFSAAGDAAPSNTAFATTFPDVAARVCRHEVSPYTSYIRFTSVAYNGSQWAAAWDDQRDGNPPQIFFELLNADGTPGGTTIQVTDGDFPSQFPTLRWNGSSFGLIYLTHMRDPDGEFIPIQPRFTRLDAGGNPIRRGVLLDLSPYTFVINDNVQDTLVWDGSHWGWFISLVDTAPSDDAPSDLAYFRLTEDGDIAAGPIFLTDTPESEYDPTAAWNGSEYGVAWLREDTSQILFQRMQADGTLLDTPRVLWENQSGTYYTSTVWDGIGWAVAWMDTPDDGSEVIYLQRLDGAGNPLGGPSRVSDDFDPAFPPEDEVPVYDEAPELQVKPGGGYLIFTSSYLSTSFANEIAVLEADAGGNRVGNRRILSPEDGNHGIYQHAVTDGSDFLVGYSDDWNGNREMADLVADASGALVAGPNTVTSGHSREDAYYPRVTSFQDGFVIFWRQMVSGTSELHARIYDGSGSMTAALTPLATRDLLRSPAAVAVGDVFAVAWEEASGNALLFDLYDAGGSSLLGEIEVTNGSWRRGMDLGWSGEVFGVTWVEDNLLHFAKVAIDGTVLGPAVAVPATDGARQPRMQWVGSGWAVVWRMGSDLYYALLDSAGAVVVPATPITFTPSTPTTDYHLQWTGELLGLAWTENRGGVGGRGIYFTVLGLDGVKAFPEVSAVDYLIWSDYSPVLVWRDGLFRLVHASGHGGVREIDLLPDGTVLPEERLLSNHSGALHLDWNGVTAGLLYAHRGDMVFMTTACLDDDTPPPSPELFGIFDGLTVSLSWTGVDDPESGILSYYLYRDGVLLAELPSSTFSLDDDGFVPGGLHVYEIQSYNGAMMESEPTAESTVAVATGSAADLEVTKSDSVDPVLAGNPLTYHLTVTNYGPDEATGVVLVDELPAGVEFVFSDPDAPTCEETAGTVTCDLATLGAGNSIDVTIEVFVEPGTPGVITNVATVAANEADTVAANNSVAEPTTVESALPGATALDATAESTSEVRLRWTDPGGGELGFRLERSPDGVDWTAFDAVAADVVTYLDQGLEAESLYYYQVVAFSGIGDGAPSNVATASTFPAAAARVCRTRIGPVHESARMISVAHNGSRWGAAWQASEGGEPGQIFFQLLDQTTLAPIGSPLQITHNDMYSQFPTLRWNGTHFGLLWTEHMRVPDGSVVGSFFFALLEADGTKVRGDVRIFADDDGGYLTSSLEMPLVWVGDGWGAFNLEGLSTPIDIVYYHLDADGDVVDGPVQLSTPEAEEDVAAAWN
ncbi:MAG: DUF11 domain-containing protein, partial [bacterium]|nr:DUF11 domain-containing protein [bacterium]